MLDDSAAWLPLDDLRGVAMVHVDARWPAGASLALEAARARGIPTMLDGDIAPREVLARLVPLADFAVFSDAGLLAYTGSSDVDTALAHVAASHDGHVGATCGRDGYAWCERGLLRRVPAPAVEVVDTLAAGDIFHGAFALAILEGQPVEDAARFACTARNSDAGRVSRPAAMSTPPTSSESPAAHANAAGSGNPSAATPSTKPAGGGTFARPCPKAIMSPVATRRAVKPISAWIERGSSPPTRSWCIELLPVGSHCESRPTV